MNVGKSENQLLPQEVSSEEVVLGCLLLVGVGDEQGKEWVDPVYTILSPRDFYRARNGWIFEACISLRQRGAGLDQVLVGSELSHRGRLEDVGGPAYLSYLVSRVSTPFHAKFHAERVKDAATRREIIEQAGQQAGAAWSGKPLTKPDTTIFDL